MKKKQHKQNTTMNLNYFLGSQDESITKPLKKNGSWFQNKTCDLSEQTTD